MGKVVGSVLNIWRQTHSSSSRIAAEKKRPSIHTGLVKVERALEN